MMISRLLLISVLLTGLLAGCKAAGPGSVSGQIKGVSAEGSVQNVPGAQVILRGPRDTYTTVSTEGEGSGDGKDGTYNYRFENVPAGTYTMAVTPPQGSTYQPETDIAPFQVKADEMFPQSVLLLPAGMAKPRPLAPSEVGAGETGYVNQRGERVVYQQGGLDTSDFLLMYLLFRNPPFYGFGAPPVIYGGPSTTTGRPSYRVDAPPATTTSGQRVTTRPPSVAGQGATRPGSGPTTSGAGPTYRPSTNGSSPSSAGSSIAPGAGSSNGTVNSGSSSQGVTRPSSGSSAPRVSVPSFSGRSSGGRK